MPATDKHDTGMEYLSKERYDEIVAELDNLMNVEYPRIRDDLSEARAQRMPNTEPPGGPKARQ